MKGSGVLTNKNIILVLSLTRQTEAPELPAVVTAVCILTVFQVYFS